MEEDLKNVGKRHTINALGKENAKDIARLPLEDAKKIIITTLDKLKDEKDYLGESCRQLLDNLLDGCTEPYGGYKNIFEIIKDFHKIGDLLAKLGVQEITVKIYEQINSPTTTMNEHIKSIWFKLTCLCYFFCNASEKLCSCLGDAGAIEQIIEGMKIISNIGIKNNDKRWKVIFENSSKILYHIAKFTESRYHFQQAKAVQFFMKLKDAGNSSDFSMLLPYIVDENEYDIIADQKDLILDMIYFLNVSFETVQSESPELMVTLRLYKRWEFIRCLSKLAVHDSNKSKIIEKGALVEFAKVFTCNDVREVRNVTECLWTLAFDKNVRQAIKDAPGIVSSLEKLKDSDDTEIRKNVHGVLWMVDGKNDDEKSHASHIEGDKHIFISYNWAEKNTVKMIHKRLKELGYKVWVDYENMSGSTLQAMAEAVEKASVVLVCMSEKYLQSPNCRTEAEYTYKKKKEYIPLMMQKKYDPDGWLGALLGTKLYFDFSGKYPFENKIQELVKELTYVLETNKIQDKKLLGAGQVKSQKVCEIL